MKDEMRHPRSKDPQRQLPNAAKAVNAPEARAPVQATMKPKSQSSESPRLRPSLAWIRARVALVRQIKKEVAARLGPEPADVKTYRRRLERELRGKWHASSKAELLNEIERVDVVYGADFHAHGQAQRTHLKILRALSSDRPVVLALECVAVQSQKYLDQYLAGKIDIDELPSRLKWEKTWGFPWENYKPLLELARRRGFSLLALNEPRRAHLGLELREKVAAKSVADAHRRAQGALIYVIFGALHLASRHLPRLVREELDSRNKLREITVHLNNERLYFELARKGLELSVDVVRLNNNRYCILSAPPWVQWQSFLLFLERNEDLGLRFDEDEVDEARSSRAIGTKAVGTKSVTRDAGMESTFDSTFDPTDHVASLIRMAAHDLGVTVKFDHLSVYSVDDNRVWRNIDRTLKPAERAIARQLLASGRSFYIPQTGTGYLAQPTINHAAALAGFYLHARLSNRKRSLWNFPHDLGALIWNEACAYFVSKLINHKRQSETLSDLRAQLALSGEADRGREAMRLALDRFMSEVVLMRQGRLRAPKIRPRQKSSYLEAARILGGMMGERLYMAHRSHKLEPREIVRWLSRDVTSAGFADDYVEILRLLDDIETGGAAGGSTRTRRERL